MTESTNQMQPFTLEYLDKAIEEFETQSVSFYKAMALSSIDIIPDPKLPSNYWCVRCSPDIYTKIQIEIDKANAERGI